MNDICKSDVKRTLGEQFGFTNVAIFSLGQNTISSNVLRIEADSQVFVLKVSSWYVGFANDPSLVLETVYGAAELLSVQGVPLQIAHRTKFGSFVFQLDGLPAVLLEYREGVCFDASQQHFAAAGTGLALFHRAGMRALKADSYLTTLVQQQVPTEKPYEESLVLYRAGFRDVLANGHVCSQQEVCQAVRDHILLIDDTIALIESAYTAVPILAQGIVHNDLNTGNLLYKEDGSIGAILDVDQLGTGALISDVGNTLVSLVATFLKEGYIAGLQDRAREFLRAYHAVMPLETGEYSLLVAAALRWDLMRVLRTMRRHHFENDRLPGLVPKLKVRLLPRLAMLPDLFSFIKHDWIEDILTATPEDRKRTSIE